MIEQLEDKQGGLVIFGLGFREVIVWGDFMVYLGLWDCFWVDEFCKVINKQYLWDNRRDVLGIICLWLDRIYLN